MTSGTDGTSTTLFRRVSRRVRFLSGPLRPMRRWLLVVAGLVATVLGAVLVTHPLDSLTLLGVYIGISCAENGQSRRVRGAEGGLPDAP